MDGDRVAIYDPSIFDVENYAEARTAILTSEGPGFSTDDRWIKETPWVVDKIAEHLNLEDARLLDFGCGVGRIAKELIRKFDCWTVGVDTSPNMRALAASYVNAPGFLACDTIWLCNRVLPIEFDAAIAIWSLQHCPNLEHDIGYIADSICVKGLLFVVNTKHRLIPARGRADGYPFVSDGKDVKLELTKRFSVVVEGDLPPSIFPHAHESFWAVYEKS